MKLKSPGKRTIRGLVVTGVALAGAASLVMTQTPAFADPGVTYVAVGSDTIQDFTNGWASSLTPGLLGSYNAVNPVNATAHEVITPAKTGITTSTTAIAPENCSFNRPNGSGEGVKSLLDSLGVAANSGTIAGENISIGTNTGTLPANEPQANCVDIARSSSAPTNVDQTAGPLQFIPFALDAVTSTVGPSSSQTIENAAGTGTEASPTTNLSALVGVGFSLSGLQAMFGSGNDAVANGVTSGASTCYAPFQGPDALTQLPAGVTCSSTVTVDLYIPQSGSGTLKFWASQMSFTASCPPAWDHQVIVNGAGHTLADYASASPAVSVEEHDGTAFAADPNGIGPFSIAQWIAQNNGIDARFHGAQLLPVGGTPPTTGGTPGTLNTSFLILRDVYEVAPYNHLSVSGATNADPALTQLLVSVPGTSTSLLCQQKLLIQHYGFGVITATNNAPNPGVICGQVVSTLRADN